MIKFSDTEKCAPLWEKLADATTPELAAAMKDYYSIYDAELVKWFAGLYDPKIGGWYYSPSARDNEKCVYKDKEYVLLPDAESTCQALGFIGSSGIARNVDNDYTRFLDEQTKSEIADYIYGLQDPDGFFYHPQWGKNIALSRRARDFNWSRSMLSRLDRPMKYPTMLDEGEKKNENTLIPEHLSSKEKYIAYLDSLNIPTNSYSAGNTLSSQYAQVKSQGFGQLTVDYINSLQNPETGHWHSETNYYAINGLMKISGIYNSAGIVIPHSKEAAFSAISAICSDEQVKGAVDLWNIWVAIHNICTSLLEFGGEEGERTVREIREELWKIAVPAVIATKEKIHPFKRADHAYSYGRNYPSIISQGCPVCIPGCDEGDINGCVIATVYMIGMVYNGLGIPADIRVPLYGEEEGRMFLDIIAAKRKESK